MTRDGKIPVFEVEVHGFSWKKFAHLLGMERKAGLASIGKTATG